MGENVRMFSTMIGRPILIEESDKSRYRDRFILFEKMYQNLEMGYSPENLKNKIGLEDICLPQKLLILQWFITIN